MMELEDDPETLVRRFYALRQGGDPETLRPLMRVDVVWREPEIGDHMGELRGVDAVIDMMRRALETTGGTFALEVGTTLATATGCAAVIHWRADKGSCRIGGRELAVFRVEEGRIAEAWFLPERVADDHAFWT